MSKSIYDIKPTTLLGIKQLAKKISKAEGVRHHVALDKAAKQAGYQNFTHARHSLERMHYFTAGEISGTHF